MQMPIPNLTEKQTKIINSLAELLNFGGETIQNSNLSSKQRPRKKALILMFSAVHNYSESIFCLLKESRTHAAEVLLRPIFETYINLQFIYIGRNEKNAVKFLLEESYSKKNLIEKIQQFTEKNLNIDTTNNYNDPKWLSQLELTKK
ncbi:MAG: DUF5677 domain-containing protein, partial [Bacteroidales bacterium]|nr:DUF5677 domain-containing protein [Bacteroidales bacterium]